MLRGIYAAAAGMINQRERLDVISNNLANISTTAYKRSQPVSRGFYQIFAEEVVRFPSLRGSQAVPGGGSTLDATADDFSPGPLVDTGNPLDVAIDGPGFFVVRAPAGERYTRAGNFSLNPEGQLVTQNGEPVLGEQGAILIDRNSAIRATIEQTKPTKMLNTVGSGDALLATFLAGIVQGQNKQTSLTRALAVSWAACLTPGPASFDPKLAQKVQSQVRIEQIGGS